MESSDQEGQRLEFGDLTHIRIALGARRQQLLDDKHELQLNISGLGVTYHARTGRPIIPQGKEREYEKIFQNVLDIEKKIKSIPVEYLILSNSSTFVRGRLET